MLKIVLKSNKKEIHIDSINHHAPIFVKQGGVFIGMVLKKGAGWTIALGISETAYSGAGTLEEFIERTISNYSLEFFTESTHFD